MGGTYPAPAGSSLSMPEDVGISWSDDYNEEHDQIGMFIMSDLSVLDPAGRVLDSVEVEVLSNWGGVYLLPITAVKTVDYPSSGAGIDTYEQFLAACDSDDDGVIDAEAEDWCSWYWDSSSDQFFELASDYSDVAEFGPNYFLGATDNRGLLRIYIYVDSLPGSDGTYTDVSISASIGVATGSFLITAL
jgi:hypothetical protein